MSILLYFTSCYPRFLIFKPHFKKSLSVSLVCDIDTMNIWVWWIQACVLKCMYVSPQMYCKLKDTSRCSFWVKWVQVPSKSGQEVWGIWSQFHLFKLLFFIHFIWLYLLVAIVSVWISEKNKVLILRAVSLEYNRYSSKYPNSVGQTEIEIWGQYQVVVFLQEVLCLLYWVWISRKTLLNFYVSYGSTSNV